MNKKFDFFNYKHTSSEKNDVKIYFETFFKIISRSTEHLAFFFAFSLKYFTFVYMKKRNNIEVF